MSPNITPPSFLSASTGDYAVSTSSRYMTYQPFLFTNGFNIVYSVFLCGIRTNDFVTGHVFILLVIVLLCDIDSSFLSAPFAISKIHLSRLCKKINGRDFHIFQISASSVYCILPPSSRLPM